MKINPDTMFCQFKDPSTDGNARSLKNNLKSGLPAK